MPDMKRRRKRPLYQCPECDSKNAQHRKSDNTYRCRRCGHVWPKRKRTDKGKK